ncbi:unnamed protein product [Danaus chrysippus]|uniref:Uncharacterized protein n=2 Tax=Danaus TaxID=13036 RepID=A0A212FE13_DANPL|nr:uncharacterized protein LOC116766894 [Danaus plexippus]OWR51996.1 hypothetical protein KGM_208988 [Danaus plexippus plexippus]CAG9559739.1 unnamed protein product [Danaus chrysippus]
MRSRLLAIHKGFASISQSRKLSTKPSRCQPHMNELPVPCGPWDPWYRQKQRFYMRHFLLGLAWWLFSFGLAIYTDSLYLNFSPPAFPSPPSDFVEECDDSDT